MSLRLTSNVFRSAAVTAGTEMPAHGPVGCGAGPPKLAKMGFVAALAVTTHEKPEHPPPQPTKFESLLAVGDMVMTVPGSTAIAQVPGQSMPAGAAGPRPDPAPPIWPSTPPCPAANPAPPCVSPVMPPPPPPVPEQVPLQPMNCVPAAGT